MTDRPGNPDGLQPVEHKTPEPRVDTLNCAGPAFLQTERKFQKAQEFERRVLAPRAKASLERMEREHFGEVGNERSRRKMFYSHNWATREGYSPQTPLVATDAALLAANCSVPLQLSSENPELGPMFGPDLILFSGRGDSCDDFRYPSDGAANPATGRRANSGRCKTELRAYDTLVCAILLSIKHHLGDSSYVRAGGGPDGVGWRDAFELYRRTIPERETPMPDNWLAPGRSR